MHTIAVLDYRMQPEAQKKLQTFASNEIVFYAERCPEGQWADRIGDAEIALVSPWDKIDKSVLGQCPNLKYVGVCGTSMGNIDLIELKKRDISYSNIVTNDKQSVAEYFFMMLISLARGEEGHQWKPGQEHELHGFTMGIVGLGGVGQAMSRLAIAFGMKTVYFSPTRKQEWEDRGLQYLEMRQLVSESHMVAVCSPRNIIVMHEQEFQSLKPGSIVVQASSGSSFDADAFREWIAVDGNYALFDMSAGVENYLRYKDLPGVIFSTKVAGDTHESNARRGQKAIGNLQEYLEGAAT